MQTSQQLVHVIVISHPRHRRHLLGKAHPDHCFGMRRKEQEQICVCGRQHSVSEPQCRLSQRKGSTRQPHPSADFASQKCSGWSCVRRWYIRAASNAFCGFVALRDGVCGLSMLLTSSSSVRGAQPAEICHHTERGRGQVMQWVIVAEPLGLQD